LTKKRTATLAVCAVLLFCIIAAGCTGPTASPTLSTANNSSTKTVSSKATSSAQAVTTVTPTPSVTPTPTSSPSVGGSKSLTVQYFYELECPVCKNFTKFQMAQFESSLSAKHPGKVSIVKISNPDAYGVNTVPTLVLLNNGVEVGRWVNPADTTAISSQIDSLLYAG
jgi:hypothetical protein